MGKKKDTVNIQTSSSVAPTPTPEEIRLNQLALQQAEAAQAGSIQAQTAGLDLVNRLLTGGQLPGAYGNLYEGISEDMVTDIAGKAVQDITPSFQKYGLLDSGVRASVSARTAGDVRRGAAQFNLSNRYNLLGLALGGQGQVQTPIIQQSSLLSQRLAGLRNIDTTGSSNQTSKSMNPFLYSFQTSFGQGLGNTFSNPSTYVAMAGGGG